MDVLLGPVLVYQRRLAVARAILRWNTVPPLLFYLALALEKYGSRNELVEGFPYTCGGLFRGDSRFNAIGYLIFKLSSLYEIYHVGFPAG